MQDILVVGIFGGIAGLHYYVEHVIKVHHFNLHWLALATHPVALVMLKDWIVHLLVYSKWALVVH